MSNPDSDCLQLATMRYSNGDFTGALTMLQPLLAHVPASADALNLAAICAYHLNRLDQAETYWRRAMAEHPEDAGPVNNLGNLLNALGRIDEAAQAYRRAIELRPDFAQAHYNLANIDASQTRDDEAERGFRRAIELQPTLAEAHYNLGNLLLRGHRPAEAEMAYRAALSARHDYVDARTNLGNLLREHGRADEALTHLMQVAAARPNSADAHFNAANALRDAERLTEAEAAYLRALALDGGHVGARHNLAELLHRLDRYDEAEARYRDALALTPSNVDDLMGLGNVLFRATVLGHGNRFGEAERVFRTVLELRPDHADVRQNLGLIAKERGRLDEAEAVFRDALDRAPDSHISKINLATVLLQAGRYAEGLPLLEARYHATAEGIPLGAQTWPDPFWRGEPLHGKSMVVLAEQGFGDVIQFCRYLPILKSMGLTRLTMLCQPALQSLLRTVDGVDVCLTPADLDGPPRADFWCLLLSVPFLLGTTLDSIPAPVRYLSARAERVQAWRERLPANGLRVGIVWGGEPRKWAVESIAHFSRRHVPPSLLAPLLETPDVSFVSLQHGPVARAQIGALPASLRPFDPMNDAADFEDTAAIMASLDLVISVDTSVAHLAGALGKPVWILLCSNADWRWLDARDDSPWYPSARLFRQKEPGEWQPVIEAVRRALDDFVQRD